MLTCAEQRRFNHRETHNPEAYDYFLRGQEQDQLDTREANMRARELLKLDPRLSSAHSHLCRNYTVSYINQWDLSKGLLQTVMELGEKAVELDESNPHAHF